MTCGRVAFRLIFSYEPLAAHIARVGDPRRRLRICVRPLMGLEVRLLVERAIALVALVLLLLLVRQLVGAQSRRARKRLCADGADEGLDVAVRGLMLSQRCLLSEGFAARQTLELTDT